MTGNNLRAAVAESRYSALAFRNGSTPMPRYYFHLEDGQVLLDDTGSELGDVAAAQNEALRASGDLLRGGRATAHFWNGTPWRMWVTDKPDGEGKTFFTLRFSGEM